MKIACIGAGPAGLYFAISMKLRDSAHEIEVFERNAPGVTFGWGVVFSDQTVENLAAERGTSINTIRAHVRGVLTKTGRNRQADVVALLNRVWVPPGRTDAAPNAPSRYQL